MSETERQYAQITKEALAITWASSKFSDYILGRKFLVETAHKPLIPLLSTKHLDILPPRILRFRLRLAKFNYTVFHVPGKLLYAADALSRAPVPVTGDESLEVETFVVSITEFTLPDIQRVLLVLHSDMMMIPNILFLNGSKHPWN